MLMPMTGIRSITCRVADHKVTFARYRPFTFWNRVREAFIGSL
jgi:NAD+ kinase